MAGEATCWHCYLADLEASLASEIHPHARAIIGEWLGEAHAAAGAGDMAEFGRLVAMVGKKARDEVAWHRQCLASARRAPSAGALP